MKKRSLALFLCLLMVIAMFAGCGSRADTRPDEEKIIGRWKCTLNAADVYVSNFEHMMDTKFNISKKAEFLVYFDFHSDGTGSMSVDAASTEKLKASLIDITKDMFKDDSFNKEGLFVYAAEEGMDIDTALNIAADQSATEFSSYVKQLYGSGSYRIENGKLYFEEDVYTYKFSGGKLVLTYASGTTVFGNEFVLTKIS